MPLPNNSIPERLIVGILAQEDHQFFEHTGVNWRLLLESLKKILRTGSASQGASTIPMQVSSLCYRSVDKLSERNRLSGVIRKISEFIDASLMVFYSSREEILRAYVSLVPLIPEAPEGTGERGFLVAARYYFQKELKDCSVTDQWRLILTLRNRVDLNPDLLASFDNLSIRDREILRRAQFRQKSVVKKYGDLIRSLRFVEADLSHVMIPETM